jgi:hypothetical protein
MGATNSCSIASLELEVAFKKPLGEVEQISSSYLAYEELSHYSRHDIYRRREKYRHGTFQRIFRVLNKNFFDFFFQNNILQIVKNQNIQKKIRKSFFGSLF